MRGSKNARPSKLFGGPSAQFEGRIVATSSFQTQSIPLLHLFARICPKLPVVFLETGYHFPETLAFRDKLVRELALNVENVSALVGREEGKMQFG